jgi:hypothetical protein
MEDLEVGGLWRTSSITKDAAKNAEFDDLSTYNLAYAGGASSTGREEGSTQEDFAAVRHLGGRVAEKAGLLVGGRAHG